MSYFQKFSGTPVMKQEVPVMNKTDNGLVFKFKKPNFPDPNVDKTASPMSPNGWLKTIVDNKMTMMDWDERRKLKEHGFKSDKISPEHCVMMEDSSVAEKYDYTHSGLIQYVFTAWAKELGVVLRPDMFMFTIASEIKNLVYEKPEEFRSLFTTSAEKTNIVIVQLTIEKLISKLQTLIPNKNIFDVYTNTHFESAPPNFNIAMAVTMCDMVTPYYNFMTTMCGIPQVMVKGTESEWKYLVERVDTLINEFKVSPSTVQYLQSVKKTLMDMVQSAFHGNGSIFSTMFAYEKNKNCGSGHAEVLINGWIKCFYVDHKYDYISSYPSHLSCLPYNDEDIPEKHRYYYYATGLSTSTVTDGFLHPNYAVVHTEIVGSDAKTIFGILAKK